MSAERRSRSLLETTGRDYGGWFELLDEWGAAGRPYAEIRDWLVTEQGISNWWAQKLIVEYEQDRGIRKPGARPDGTFSCGASRTISASAATVFAAFAEEEQRDRWLPPGSLRERSATPPRRVGFDWQQGSSRVQVMIEAKAADKATVSVEHSKLADAETAEKQKAYWRDRLGRLRSMLEQGT